MRGNNRGAAPWRSLKPFHPSAKLSVAAGRVIVASGSARRRAELRTDLEFEGHQVTEAETSGQTTDQTCSGRHNVLILDSQLEDVEVHDLCRAIRARSDLGIIVLAGDDTQQARIDALNAGADDYVPSPFVVRELLAQVRALLRRVTHSDAGRRILLQDRAIDLNSYEIKGPGSRVSHLTPKEFGVLECLVAHANQAFTHENLAQTVWQRDGAGEVEFVRVVIGQLRRKLEPDPNNPRYILTERSVGYRFQMPAGMSNR
jgi:two-component system KDP operon response regulator KdpE